MTDQTDTSAEAVERFIQGTLKEHVISEGLPRTSIDTQDAYETVELLRALLAAREAAEAERDALKTVLVREKSDHRAAIARHGGKVRALQAEAAALREATTEIVSMLWKRMAEGEQRITSTEARVYQKLRATLATLDQPKEGEDNDG